MWRAIMMAMHLVVACASLAQAGEPRARFVEIRALEAVDPRAALAQMRVLAEEEYPAAASRMGYYYRHGVGAAKDLEVAKMWLGKAASQGHPWSFAALARVALERGEHAEALDILRAASKEGRPDTARLLATAHIDRTFGAASRPKAGVDILVGLAREGDSKAGVALVLRHNWKRVEGRVPSDVITYVAQAGLNGDVRAAEAALVYLTNIEEQTQLRADLLQVPRLRNHIRSLGQVQLAFELRPKRFWSEVEDILNAADRESYPRVANTAFWINKNAWVRVLQKELRALGYYSGRINAMMTPGTIRAQNRFCREAGIWDICATGPLRGATVRAVSAQIAERTRAPQG